MQIELFQQSIKKENRFLNPEEKFGTLKKGVVLVHKTYNMWLSKMMIVILP